MIIACLSERADKEKKKKYIITSPIPEEAPVMMTTLPATSSLKREDNRERKNLQI